MIVKFNKFERVAGVFVLAAVLGAGAMTVFVAVKKGWFSSKVNYTSVVTSADGLHPGTKVQIAGIRAGEVKEVELLSAKEIRVHFEVLKKYQMRVRKDSHVQVIRPFVIGEKVVEISVGSDSEDMLGDLAEIPSIESFDMMDLVSGKKLGPFLASFEGLMNNMSTLARAFADPKRTEAFVEMFDRMSPLIDNLNEMSKQVVVLTRDLNKMVPGMVKEDPEVGRKISRLIGDLQTVTRQLSPAMTKVGPQLPQASLRALEALDEAVVLLKAMQKSFMIRGNVEEVREEEAKNGTGLRKPAGK